MNNSQLALFCLNSFGIKLRIDSFKLIALLMVLIPCLMSCDRGEDRKSISESKLPRCSGEVESAWNNCYGEMKYESGDAYRGEYKEGKYFGKGELLMNNGDKFLGNWIGGLKNGQGKYIWKEGDVFEGEFKLGLRQGKATYSYYDGRKFIGYYENDKRLNGREYNKDGNLTKEWSHGVMSAVSPTELRQEQDTNFAKQQVEKNKQFDIILANGDKIIVIYAGDSNTQLVSENISRCAAITYFSYESYRNGSLVLRDGLTLDDFLAAQKDIYEMTKSIVKKINPGLNFEGIGQDLYSQIIKNVRYIQKNENEVKALEAVNHIAKQGNTICSKYMSSTDVKSILKKFD